uniref:Uncharacterized protein n=1 Tax=Trichuris muris TaxID=70415 RepID=A0A5S6R550_TRIMR
MHNCFESDHSAPSSERSAMVNNGKVANLRGESYYAVRMAMTICVKFPQAEILDDDDFNPQKLRRHCNVRPDLSGRSSPVASERWKECCYRKTDMQLFVRGLNATHYQIVRSAMQSS